MFDGIKQAIAADQWEEVGSLIAGGMNGVVDKIDTWITGTFEPAGVKWAGRIARVLNGLIADLDFTKIGKMLADGLNAIFNIANTFLTTFDWATFGKQVANGVNGWFQSINWTLLGQTIANGCNAVIRMGANFVATINWAETAKSVAEGLKSWFNTVDWESLKQGIVDGINGIVTGAETFITSIDWNNVQKTFSDGINGIIDGIDWSKMILTLFLGIYNLFNTVFKTVASINWEGLGTSIGEGLNKVFGKDSKGNSYINWADLGKNFGDAVKGIITGIDSFITTTDWQAVGDAIGTALTSIDWGGLALKLIGLLWDGIWAAASLAGGLVEKLVNWIFGTDGGETVAVPDVFEGSVAEQLREQSGEAGRMMADELETQFTAGMSAYYTEGGPVSNQIAAAAALIGTGFQSELEEQFRNNDRGTAAFDNIEALGAQLLEAIIPDDASIEQVKTAFSVAGIQVTDAYAESLTGTGAENIAASLALLAQGVDQETLAMLNSAKLHENLTAYMNETGKSLNEVASELATGTGDAMGRLLPEGMKTGLAAGEEDLQAEVDKIEEIASTEQDKQTILADAGDTGEQVPSEIGTNMSENTGDIDTAVSDITTAIEDPLSCLPEDMQPYAESMMTAITEAIVNGDPIAVAAIETAAQAVVDKAAEILSGTAATTIMTDFMNGLQDTVNNTSSSMEDAARKCAEDVRDAFSEILSFSEGSSIGNNIADGIASGITSKTYVIESAARTAAQKALKAAKRELGIASPSKEFMEVGNFTMQGMQIGLEKGSEDMLKTMSAIGDAVVQMGGGIQIPDIAAGKVIPYSAKMTDVGSAATQGPVESFATNFDETMSDQSDILKDIRDLLQRMRLTVDADSLTRAITSAQRARERAYGGV